MNDIVERLRHTAGHLINGTVEDGAVETRLLCDAADEIERMRAERLKLDRRIHNQRRSCRETWEIVEMRRKWLGSDTARKRYANLLKRYRELKAGANHC